MRPVSRRQRQVLDGLLSGQTQQEVACALGLSRRTVEYYLAILRRKLNARTTVHLIKRAIELRVVQV